MSVKWLVVNNADEGHMNDVCGALIFSCYFEMLSSDEKFTETLQ